MQSMIDLSNDLNLQTLHPLLLRQLKTHLKVLPDQVSGLSDDWQKFISAIDRAYHEFEEDQAILERSLNLSSEELLDANTKLQDLLKTMEAQVENRTQALSKSNAALKKALKKLKETQLQLIQTEKMSSLGQMVAGIAHEINNPLGFIQGNLGPLCEYFESLCELVRVYQAEYPQPTATVIDKTHAIDLEFLLADLPQLLDSMRLGTERVNNIVISLRNFSRMDEAAIKDVNIHEGLDSTLLILNHRIRKGIEIVKEYGDLPLIRCSPAQLNQVFTNIIANALDAMFEADSEPKQLTIQTRAIAKSHVQICIRDTGPGIPPAIKSKIFDPFFTTKAVGKGTGLGLGISFQIIQQHQGQVEVNSEVGKGAEFIITLPVQATFTKLGTVMN